MFADCVVERFRESTGFELERSCVFACYAGSKAHNTHVPKEDPSSIDDVDIVAVVVPPRERVYGLHPWGDRSLQIQIDEWDVTVHALPKFVKLCLNGNPNVIATLWTREAERLLVGPALAPLLEQRAIFSSRRIVSAFMGYAAGQLKKMRSENAYQGYMGAKRKAMVDRFGFDCYEDTTTEFLTDAGWKRYDAIDDSARLATVEIATGKMVFQAPTARTDRVHTGELYTIAPYSTRAVVTPHHKLLVSPMRRSQKNGFSHEYDPLRAEWQLRSPAEIIASRRSHFHVRRAPAARVEEYEHASDSYLLLAGLFLSDGSLAFRDGRPKDVRLYQKKAGRYNDLADGLMATFPLRKYEYAQQTIWSAHGEVARRVYSDFGHADQKRLPPWCLHLSARQADVLWEGLMAGDGYARPHRDVLYTNSKALAGDIQAAMISAGHPCTVYGPFRIETSPFGPNDMYQVVRSKKSGAFHALNFGRRLGPDATDADNCGGHPVRVSSVDAARVVCFEVPNGTLVTRNNGRVAIHGNCKHGAHLVRLLRMCAEFCKTGTMQVWRTEDAEEIRAIKSGAVCLELIVE